jgi:hypothetical protein
MFDLILYRVIVGLALISLIGRAVECEFDRISMMGASGMTTTTLSLSGLVDTVVVIVI